MSSEEGDPTDSEDAKSASTTFVYTGEGGERIPGWASHVRVAPSVAYIPEGAFKYRPRLRRAELHDDLVAIGRAAFFDCESLERIEIPPSVSAIPEGCFQHCGELAEATLHEGVAEIGMHAFDGCRSLGTIVLPRTVRRIGKSAFFNSVSRIELPDGIDEMGDYALSQCRFPVLRIPPAMAHVPLGALRSCKNAFSLELPPGGAMRVIEKYAFSSCHSLRNAAIPPGARAMEYVFQHCTDLEQLFGSSPRRIEEKLRQRFDNLPIHELCYFQSYRNIEMVVGDLEEAVTAVGGGGGTLNATGEQQDSLGMTPLHILCCSTRHSLELCRAIITCYPDTLVTTDKWGGLPILYAFWSEASNEMMQYLLDCHESIFPDHRLNWEDMATTLAMANAPLETIHRLLDAHQTSFPGQIIDWDVVLDRLAKPIRSWKEHHASGDAFRFLIRASVAGRVKAIGLELWRERVMGQIARVRDGHRSRRADLANFHAKLVHYEREYEKLKVATSMLELVIWRAKMLESGSVRCRHEIEEPEYRRQCRISCGADNVVENVLPFLLPASEM